MKLIVTLLATVAVVNAYTCPATPAVNIACGVISVSPLLCSNPKVNVAACNEKQCNQTYIDNYAACQCRRSPTLFYEHSVNVDGLLRRCGVDGLTNPFGNPDQYRPGQGTQTFSPSGGSGATRIFSGTTYYGGSTSVISGTTRIVDATAVVNGTWIAPGTTTWVSNTPGIVQGTSTSWVGAATTTAQPIEAPSATPVQTVVPVVNQNYHMSGGAIAGTVLGSLAAFALAGLLGWCWRKKRAQHTTLYSNSSTTAVDTNAARAPSRTVVTEKIEPVVVKSVPTTNTHVVTPGTTAYSTPSTNTYNSTNTGYNSNNTNTGYNVNNTNTGYNGNNTVPVNTYSSASNPTSTAHTTYNTATNANTGYSTQPRTSGVLDSVSNGVHNTANATGNAVSHGVNSAGNTVGNAIHGTSHSTGNTMH
ncbi:hypothetical protein EC957_008457 [Mortierella hygrophila]|uniref:Extracellular membrane protein CFEM domain-containing protein n=1 Tax=Mortierella hygrophila TaxID=979708 RepID=A0A9P6FCQ5_9FUNG|nr:hypothetical protein EC957_008457 [Mortierella hygrophila]